MNEQHIADRQRIRLLTYIMLANFIVLLCITFNWCWWEEHFAISIGLCIFYLLFVCFIHMDLDKNAKGLFYVFDSRNECWRDFYESPDFIYNNDYAPLYNSDSITIANKNDSECKHLIVRKTAYYLGKDIDFNKQYNTTIELVNLSNKIEYSSKCEYCYGFSEVIKELNIILKNDGYSIIAIFNPYGDMRWRKSEKKTTPSKWRRFLYNVMFWSARIIYFAMVILPVVVILKIPIILFLQ